MKILASFLCLTLVPLIAQANIGDIIIKSEPEGGLSSITIEGDTTAMNWIVSPDNSQYPWIGPEYQWGLGNLKINGEKRIWSNPSVSDEKKSIFSISDELTLTVERKIKDGDLFESYTFCNNGDSIISLEEIEIHTPFNDNYPDAHNCINKRAHAHIWSAGTGAYVMALRMGNYAPHLGLMLTDGSLEGYSIKERSSKKGSSNTRGIITLNPESSRLSPGQEYTISWRLFSHDGRDDFFSKLIDYGGIRISADKYVAKIGEDIQLTAETKDSKKTSSIRVDSSGDFRVPVEWRGGITYAEIFGVSDFDKLLEKRADFILKNQVYRNPGNVRDGSILPYDNVNDQIYLNWKQPSNWSDANEGRERVGAALFLASLAGKTRDIALKDSLTIFLKKYASFLRNGLQDRNYDTWSDTDKANSRIGSDSQKRRIYNYPWIAHFYFLMYQLTNDPQYLDDGYGTMTACYRNGGYDFYAIDTPIVLSIRLLREAGKEKEAELLLAEYRKAAETYMRNGVDYPKSEVNFEQSIVAPSVNFILEMYLVTKEEKYLAAAKRLMPVVEAFGGSQPSSHLNDISIRHWDGYWFGLPRQWGDTMPHYWSCITADCFANYSLAANDASYMERAKNILKGNLSLFTEDGRGGAAFIYPQRVDGQPSHGLNPFANDQDTALMYFLKWL